MKTIEEAAKHYATRQPYGVWDFKNSAIDDVIKQIRDIAPDIVIVEQ